MPRRARALRLVRRHWPLILPAILTLAVFHAWVQPGLILGADWVRRVPAELNTFFPWPPAWNGAQQLGETYEVYLFEFPLFALMGLLSRLHFSWHIIERVLFLWPYLVLSVVCPYALAFRLTRSSYASALAAAMFTVNTWVIMATERGAIPSIVAAALMPLFFLVVLSFIERATVRKGLGLGLILTLILVYDLRYVYISIVFAFILAAEQLFRDRSLKRIKNSIIPIGAAVGTVIVANLYWILPQFFEKADNGSDYGTLSDYIYNSGFMTPQHALSNFAVFYHWVASDNPFLPKDPDWWFFALPVAVFVALFFTWRRKWVWSFALGAFVAVLLDSGPSWPLDKINIWIFVHVPGMTFFRDVTKWMSLLEIAYGIIIALGFTRLLAYIRLRLSKRALPVVIAMPVIAVAVYALMMSDSFNIMRFRVFATYHIHSDVLALEQFIQSQPNNDRTLVIPRDDEPMRAGLSHPYIEGMQIENGAPYDGFRHFNPHLGDLYTFFAAPYGADLLRLMNVRYVVVPYDYDKIIYSPQIAATGFYDVVDFMKSRPWLHLIKKIGRQYVFEVRDPMQARAFVAPAPFILNGSSAGLFALVGTPMINPRIAAILPDQPLNGIAKRIPNYVAGGWPIDTGAYSIAAANRFVRNSASLDSQAKRGGFGYVGEAASTATASSALFQVDAPLLLNTSFTWPSKGHVAYHVNTLNLRQVSPLAVHKTSFDEKPSLLTYSEGAADFFLNNVMNVQQAGVVHPDKANRSYHGTIGIDNLNPTSLSGRLELTGLSTSIRTRTRNVRIMLNGTDLHCTQDACTGNVRLDAGMNIASISFPVDGLRRRKTVTYGLHPMATVYDERIGNGKAAIPVRWLARNINVRMTDSPHLRLDFTGPSVHHGTARYLVYVMRSIEDGHTITVFEHASMSSPNTNALPQWTEVILLGRFNRLLASHAQDPGWLFKNRLRLEPDGYGEYSIVAIGMADVGNNVAADRSDLARWKPLELDVYSVPESYELASGDARQAIDVTYPSQWTFLAPGYEIATDSSVEGVKRFTFVRRNRAGTIRARAIVSDAKTRILDFDFHQDYGSVVKLDILDKSGSMLFSQVLMPLQRDAEFGAGSIENDDAADIPWPLDRAHCLQNACKNGADASLDGIWRHVTIDVSHLTKRWNRAYIVKFTIKPVDGRVRRISFATADRRTQMALGKGFVPALTINGRPLRYATSRPLPETLYSSLSGTATVAKGSNTIKSYPTFPIRPVSALLSKGTLRTFRSSDIQNATQRVGTEYSGTIDSNGGLLVFSEAYDPRWQLALVPKTFRPTGFALLDYLKAKHHFVADHDHYRVDDTLNGWWIPKGRNNLFMIMTLDAILQFSAIVWAALLTAWIIVVLAGTRRQKA